LLRSVVREAEGVVEISAAEGPVFDVDLNDIAAYQRERPEGKMFFRAGEREKR
jgi:hypothetical protein